MLQRQKHCNDQFYARFEVSQVASAKYRLTPEDGDAIVEERVISIMEQC